MPQSKPSTSLLSQRPKFNLSGVRPDTSDTQWVALSTIDVVRDQLQCTYKGQMNSYLRNKFRKIAGKHQQDIGMERYSSKDQNPQFSSSWVGPLQQLYSTFGQKSRVQVEKGIEGAVLTNTRQQIQRLILKKREQQDHFREINRTIRVRSQKNKTEKIRTLKQQFVIPQVQQQTWHRKWRDSLSKQKVRYRNRLLFKNNKELHTLNLVNFSR